MVANTSIYSVSGYRRARNALTSSGARPCTSQRRTHHQPGRLATCVPSVASHKHGESAKGHDGKIKADAASVVRDLRARHSAESTAALCGRVFEVHVEATYNLDAVRKGSPYRAMRSDGLTDVRIYHIDRPEDTLAQAQLKTHLHGLCGHKYDGLLRVAPTDALQSAQQLPVEVSPVLSYGGVSSAPIDNWGLEQAAAAPEAHFSGQ
ncbi:hypothetical protein GPECTOR_1g620 [Gonium pectorale]|uniref:Uncharacterized protein n=1 Tax=Gonium pectorale TaxID=33097 RepID=A0A150H3G6_GONPE|nr:hypothetical protein GPECTOR_1g620 [Gonium pectorale]|eukprot:KXZ56689.1 hypothetical protein GPECTOR_1g620 [Gonium pectorale]